MNLIISINIVLSIDSICCNILFKYRFSRVMYSQ